MIYFRIDTVMLSFLTTDTDVGFYSAAYRITEALTFIPSVLMVSIYPLMSKYFHEKNTAFNHVYTMSLKLLFASGLLLATVITFLSEIIILAIGSEYYGSIPALQILIWATSFMFVNQLLSSTYIASGNQNIMAKISAFAALFNIVLNLVLIPSYSYIGASVATLITEFIIMIYGIRWIDKNIVHKSLYKKLISPIIGICVISAFMLISKNYANVVPLSIISVLIFAAILYNTGWVGSDEIALFREILPKRNG